MNRKLFFRPAALLQVAVGNSEKLLKIACIERTHTGGSIQYWVCGELDVTMRNVDGWAALVADYATMPCYHTVLPSCHATVLPCYPTMPSRHANLAIPICYAELSSTF